jgi:aqualysin 1
MRKHRLPVLAATAIFLLMAPAAAAPPSDAAGQSKVIPGQFIVELKPGADAQSTAAAHRRTGVDVEAVYTTAFNGFTVTKADARAVARLRADRTVASVLPDALVKFVSATTQTNATWGLDRTDQRSLPLDSLYTYGHSGTGVTAYVIDTGIRSTHVEFAGRVAPGFTSVNDSWGTEDCDGHGTHVASTLGGTTYGVAKNVTLVPVRVLNCYGMASISMVLAGIDWVTQQHQENGGPSVANMSLGGPSNSQLETAVRNSIDAGITYVVAAGNANDDACGTSPANVATALTVAATDSADRRATFSNWGPCVDLFAPGVSITAAGTNNDRNTATMSGTSMSSPHVAGVAALLLEEAPEASPAEINKAILDNGTAGVVSSVNESPNVLLFSLSPPQGEPVAEDPAAEDPVAEDPVEAEPPTDEPGDTQVVTLSVSATKVRNSSHNVLNWTGSHDSTDVYRDGIRLTTVPGTTFTDTNPPKLKRGQTLRYRVCDVATAVCSDEIEPSRN